MATEIKSARDALDTIGNIAAWVRDNCGDATNQTQKYMEDIILFVKAALALPRRNCDVGTPDEQVERWNNENPYPYEWDDRQYLDAREVLGWAQMPYVEKEGGAE